MPMKVQDSADYLDRELLCWQPAACLGAIRRDKEWTFERWVESQVHISSSQRAEHVGLCARRRRMFNFSTLFRYNTIIVAFSSSQAALPRRLLVCLIAFLRTVVDSLKSEGNE
jgi:hypothetical protein